MNLAVDQGNTRTKAALFQERNMVQLFPEIPNEQLTGFINRLSPENCIVGAVKDLRGMAFDQIKPGINCMALKPGAPVPIENLYQTPATLGMDRLAGVIGSKFFKPHTNNLVIDCGTCITYDFIDSENRYRGGGISPGLSMRLRALNTFTAGLPLIEIEEHVDLVGGSTKSSILSGVAHGTAAELEGMIVKYRESYPTLSVFLCGGDAKYFESKLRGAIFVTPELVLYGLNEILLYNVKNI